MPSHFIVTGYRKFWKYWALTLYHRASLIVQLVHLQCRRPQFDSWVGKIRCRKAWQPTPVFLGFPYGSAGKESAWNVGDLGSIPGLGRCPGEGKGYPLQYSGLENSMDCIMHGVSKSRTWLSNFHFLKLYPPNKGLTNIVALSGYVQTFDKHLNKWLN